MAKRITIAFVADDEMKAAVTAAAAEEDRSISWMIREWVKDGLKKRSRRKKQAVVNQ